MFIFLKCYYYVHLILKQDFYNAKIFPCRRAILGEEGIYHMQFFCLHSLLSNPIPHEDRTMQGQDLFVEARKSRKELIRILTTIDSVSILLSISYV